MPEPDARLLDSRLAVVRALEACVGSRNVIAHKASMRAYDCDGLTIHRQLPLAVVLPETTQQISDVLAYCHENGIKVVPRGAGTGLSGGALPLADGIILAMGRLNKILDIDYDNRCLTAQSCVSNLALSKAVEEEGFYYAPDPSSQIACSIGGNVAENAGGVHCLKYGLTTNNLLGLKVVLMDGTVMEVGGKYMEAPGYDILGVLTGSEGLLGVVTEVTVRLLRTPATRQALLAGFSTVESAADCVAGIIRSGIIPAGLEMMDKVCIHAAETFSQAGYPVDAEAVLIVELDGPQVEVDYLCEQVEEQARACGASSLRRSGSEAERLRFWAGRKNAFPAVGQLAPDYLCMDGTIPRTKLADVLRRIHAMAEEYGLGCANVFHAGDGNLHPLILFDAGIEGQTEKAEAFGADILKLCVDVGGVLTGEHGVGIEKRDLMGFMFTDDDLKHQQRLKCAFDPRQLLNPGKVYPVLHRCAELGKMHIHKGQLPHPDLPRF